MEGWHFKGTVQLTSSWLSMLWIIMSQTRTCFLMPFNTHQRFHHVFMCPQTVRWLQNVYSVFLMSAWQKWRNQTHPHSPNSPPKKPSKQNRNHNSSSSSNNNNNNRILISPFSIKASSYPLLQYYRLILYFFAKSEKHPIQHRPTYISLMISIMFPFNKQSCWHLNLNNWFFPWINARTVQC